MLKDAISRQKEKRERASWERGNDRGNGKRKQNKEKSEEKGW